MSACPTPAALEAVGRAGVFTPEAARRCEALLGLGRGRLSAAGFRYIRSERLWVKGRLPSSPRHRAAVAEAFLAWHEAGHPFGTFCVEPKLFYRSPAGGPRHLDPDALLIRTGRVWAVEVDRGTEGPKALCRKWWRYREFMDERAYLALLVVAPERRAPSVRETLGRAALPAVVLKDFALFLRPDVRAADGCRSR